MAQVADSSRELSASSLPTPVSPGSLLDSHPYTKRTDNTEGRQTGSRGFRRGPACAVYIQGKFRLHGKSELILNRDLRIIDRLFAEYTDRDAIKKLQEEIYTELQESDLPRKKWQELIADFRGYFGMIVYPEFAGETPEASNLPVFTARIPGTFASPYGPPKISPKPTTSESPLDLRTQRRQEKQRVSTRITELTASEDELDNLKQEFNGAERLSPSPPYEGNENIENKRIVKMSEALLASLSSCHTTARHRLKCILRDLSTLSRGSARSMQASRTKSFAWPCIAK